MLNLKVSATSNITVKRLGLENPLLAAFQKLSRLSPPEPFPNADL